MTRPFQFATLLAVSALAVLAALAQTHKAPIAAAALAAAPSPVFREVAAETGLNFYHQVGATGDFFMPEIMGSGIALIDYDKDGDLDIYVIQGTTLDATRKPLFPPPVGWKPGNRLFRNMLKETGELRFEDVTEQAGVGYVGYGMASRSATTTMMVSRTSTSPTSAPTSSITTMATARLRT